MLNYRPEIILAGRRLNDNMGIYVANQLIKVMINRKNKIKNSRILIMGLTFKENCPDLRNSRVIDIINELKTFDCHVDVYDPLASLEEAKAEYGLNLISKPKSNYYDAIVLAVSHAKFKDMGIKKIRSFGKKNHIIYDLKYIFTAKDVDLRL
jgi:UDP-N-acetyl-D-galactosamine dehydrogenase